jgi:hypothetical protein
VIARNKNGGRHDWLAVEQIEIPEAMAIVSRIPMNSGRKNHPGAEGFGKKKGIHQLENIISEPPVRFQFKRITFGFLMYVLARSRKHADNLFTPPYKASLARSLRLTFSSDHTKEEQRSTENLSEDVTNGTFREDGLSCKCRLFGIAVKCLPQNSELFPLTRYSSREGISPSEPKHHPFRYMRCRGRINISKLVR